MHRKIILVLVQNACRSSWTSHVAPATCTALIVKTEKAPLDDVDY
jgi:hypothetical protein